MRRNQSTLSSRDVSAFATNTLLRALSGIGWISGVASVEPRLLVQLLVRAAAERRSLEAIAMMARNIPCPQTIRNTLGKLLPTSTTQLEPVIVEALHGRLPKSLKSRPRSMAIDLHTKPYYGDKKTPGTYRGQRKASTKTFFAYATLMVVRRGQTFTVGMIPVVNGIALTSIVEQLLSQAALKGLRPRCLLLDRGFYAAAVMLYLQQQNISYVMPMIRRGRSGKTKAACTATAQFFVKGRRGWTTYTWQARLRAAGQRQNARTTMTTDVCIVPRMNQKRGRSSYVFACYGMTKVAGNQLRELYRKRFRIETSYRQMRQGLAQTCSTNSVFRLLLVLIALTLRNLWVWLHWTLLAKPGDHGQRVLRLELLRAQRMLHCLVRYLDRRLAIPATIDIQNPAALAA